MSRRIPLSLSRLCAFPLLALPVAIAAAGNMEAPLADRPAETGQSAPPADEQGIALSPLTVTSTAAATREALPPAHAGGQVAKGARLGLLGNRDIMDTPFNVTSYTSQLIDDQQARTVADVLANDPSVRFTTSGTHAFENFRLRGFDVHSSDLAINSMFGLAPLGSSTLEFVERVEVLKGPSAMFTGMSPSGGVGGVINLVPKRAADEALTRVTLGYETASQPGISADVGRRFGTNDAFGVRINGSLSDGETALDGQDKQRDFLSAALDYRGDALTATLDIYNATLDFEGGSPAMYGFATTDIPKAPDPSVNFLSNAAGELESQAVIARAEYAFNDNLSAFAAYGVRNHDYSGWINGTHAHSVQANGNAMVRGVAQLGYDESASAELGARLKFSTGGAQHEVVLQATQLDIEAGALTNVTGMVPSNIYDPAVPPLAALPSGHIAPNSETTLSSLALVDTVSLLEERLLLTLGARQQKIDQTSYGAEYNEEALTPAMGVVIKPWGDDVSLYANYVEGLSKGDSVTVAGGYVSDKTFAPYKTVQTELGVKWNTGEFTNTFSLFNIARPQLLTTGTAPNLVASDGGESRVRGVEWNTFGKVSATVSLLGGVSYTQGELTKATGGVNEGNTLFGVPEWQGNLGAEWATPVNGLSLNGLLSATSEQYLNNANTHEIPASSQVDAGVRYETRVAEHKTVMRLNVNNLFDRHYWSGSFAEPRATLAAGRTVAASVSIDF